MKSNEPLSKHILPFLEYCEIEKGLSNNTQRNYEQYLKLFVKWLGEAGHPSLLPHQLSANHIWDYRLYLARKHLTRSGGYLSKKSQNYYLIALRALLDFLAERDIETLPSVKVKLAKQKDEETISFLEVRDIEKMLKIPDITTPVGLRDRTIMELLFSSGMRISELTALNIDQFTMLEGRMPSPRSETMTKGPSALRLSRPSTRTRSGLSGMARPDRSFAARSSRRI